MSRDVLIGAVDMGNADRMHVFTVRQCAPPGLVPGNALLGLLRGLPFQLNYDLYAKVTCGTYPRTPADSRCTFAMLQHCKRMAPFPAVQGQFRGRILALIPGTRSFKTFVVVRCTTTRAIAATLAFPPAQGLPRGRVFALIPGRC